MTAMTQPPWATTSNSFQGYRIACYLGVVRGLTVRSPGLGGALSASLSALGGGRVDQYIQLCDQAREEAFQAMLAHATALGANGVVAVRYDAGEIGSQGLSEVLCYGTAVVIEPAE